MSRIRWVLAALVVGAVVAITGCGDADGGETEAAVTTAPQDVPVATSEGQAAGSPGPTVPDCPPPELLTGEGIPECEFPVAVFDEDASPADRVAAIAATAREHGYEETAVALDDGELSVAERRQAYQDALDCMTAQGMEVVQFSEYEGLYGTDFSFIVGKGVLSDADGSQVSSDCEGRYTALLKTAQEILTGGRFTERAKEILQECLAEYGVTDDVGDTIDELREVSPGEEAETECIGRAEEKPPPPPGVGSPAGG